MAKNLDISAQLQQMGVQARTAARVLALASTEAKTQALLGAADAVKANQSDILAANKKDLTISKTKGLTPALLDRLMLDPARLDAIAQSLRDIAALPDPVGATITQWTQPNGLAISRVRVPIGVLGMIYESRPNVTIDAGALCLKSGNAVILRGGSESLHSSIALHTCLITGLRLAGLPEHAVQLVPTADRAAVGAMLTGLNGNLDVIIPRGGKSLVARVQAEARVPVIGHLEGVVHIYIDRRADKQKAIDIVVNAKMRRPGVCGAAEKVLIDRRIASQIVPALVSALTQAGCEMRGDDATQALDPRILAATNEDWYTEYLGPIITIALVAGVEAAITHIEQYSSGHTDCIITEDAATAQTFMSQIESAIIMQNASTQFADGGEFGMGAEIGIATGRLPPRGPVGVEQLTSYKYIVKGTGQIRP